MGIIPEPAITTRLASAQHVTLCNVAAPLFAAHDLHGLSIVIRHARWDKFSMPSDPDALAPLIAEIHARRLGPALSCMLEHVLRAIAQHGDPSIAVEAICAMREAKTARDAAADVSDEVAAKAGCRVFLDAYRKSVVDLTRALGEGP